MLMKKEVKIAISIAIAVILSIGIFFVINAREKEPVDIQEPVNEIKVEIEGTEIQRKIVLQDNRAIEIANILEGKEYNLEPCECIFNYSIMINCTDSYELNWDCTEVVKEGKRTELSKEESSKIRNIIEDAKNEINNQPRYYFYGKVIKSSEKYIIVEPNEGENIRRSADKISIGLGEKNDAIYEVGANVKITYNGEVMESYPAQIKAIKIEVKSAEELEIRYYKRESDADKKVYTVLGENEKEKYNYSIYSVEGDATILINNEEISLRDALIQGKVTMEEIISKANKDFPNAISYDDGGSREFHYEDYTIIKISKLDGNRDVYIGPADMKIHDLTIPARKMNIAEGEE